MDKKSRKAFSLKDKYDIVQRLCNGVKQSVICKEMNLSKSTVATIWKKREDILRSYENKNLKYKKLRKSAHEELDNRLIKWFTQRRQDNIPITGNILQEKANYMGKAIEGASFDCSKSWVERFKKRHNITGGKIVDESAAVNMNVVNDWLENVWPNIRRNYDSKNIFSADETGLLYQMTPDKILRFAGETCAGGKLSKARITVLVAANMNGSEKRKLLVIGKSENPRCFKNKHLPVKYKFNSKAWMTSEIFTNVLLEWDEELRRMKRSILLLVDSCSSHPQIELLQIKLIFLPPNTSPKLQPMNQGVIHSLKSHYRKILLIKMLEAIENKKNFSVSLLDAIIFVNMAWNKVCSKTICNSFKHGGFLEIENQFDTDDEIPLSDRLDQNNKQNIDNTDIETEVKKRFSEFDFEYYVSIDNDMITRQFLTDQQISESVTEDTNLNNEEEDELDECVPSVLEMVQKMNETRKFLESREVPDHVWNSFSNLENHIMSINFSRTRVQTEITDFQS